MDFSVATDAGAELDELIITLAGFSDDPLGFVMFAFPWGEPGELESATGPESWQVKILTQLAEGVINASQAIQLARTSGHGIGKSALVSWIILWAIGTFPDAKGVVTANTETQLKTKTWAELAKWYRLFVGRELFKMTATAIFSVDPEHERTWRLDMVPWSERNTEAFAGLHNQGKRILVVFDEASAIPDVIWEVTEGALTDKDTQIIWCVFGNPTRNKGRFRECFAGGKFEHRWQSLAIDSRTVSFTNKEQFERWVADYGEDSDFVRVRVRGVFPRVDNVSFIGYELAVNATVRPVPENNTDPIIIGVDVGRFGTDPTVICVRRGRDARSFRMEVLHGVDLMTQASKISAMFLNLHAACVMVDSGGVGGGVVDRLRQLQIPVWEVDFGSKPDGTNLGDYGTRYFNKRAEIWGAVRDWLDRGCIPEVIPGQEQTTVDELTGPTYSLSDREEIQLERKKDMIRRGVPSPNWADALACTFAYPVYQAPLSIYGIAEKPQPKVADDYDPFVQSRIYS